MPSPSVSAQKEKEKRPEFSPSFVRLIYSTCKPDIGALATISKSTKGVEPLVPAVAPPVIVKLFPFKAISAWVEETTTHSKPIGASIAVNNPELKACELNPDDLDKSASNYLGDELRRA